MSEPRTPSPSPPAGEGGRERSERPGEGSFDKHSSPASRLRRSAPSPAGGEGTEQASRAPRPSLATTRARALRSQMTDAERKTVMTASPVKGVYDETEDRESAYEILQKRTADHTEAEAAQAQDKEATEASGSKSRSDGFWTTFGKQVIRSMVPAATRMLEQQIKRGTLVGIRRGRGSGSF